jgi:hypothetical protein
LKQLLSTSLAIPGVKREGLENGGLQGGRCLQFGWNGDPGARLDSVEDFSRFPQLQVEFPGQGMKEKGPDLKEIRLGTPNKMGHHFRRQVEGSSHHRPGRCQGGHITGENKSKVHDDRRSILTANHDVGGLQVSVKDLAPMKFGNARGQFPPQAFHLVGFHGPPTEAFLQSFPAHQLHHQVGVLSRKILIEKLHDVGMIEGSLNEGFPGKPGEGLAISLKLAKQDLDGNVSPRGSIVGQEYLAHSSATKDLLYLVARR